VIVKMLLQQMGGHIRVASTIGRGSTFSVRLSRDAD
jgi:signal transduction histidine kinase